MSLENMPFESENNLDICLENKYSDRTNILQPYIKNQNNNELEKDKDIYNFENSFHVLDFRHNETVEINNNQAAMSLLSEENVPQDNNMNSVLNILLSDQKTVCDNNIRKLEFDNKLKIGDQETTSVQETVKQPQVESNGQLKNEKFYYQTGRLVPDVIINIENNHGNIILVKPKKELAKKDVDNPDGLAYRYDKQNGNCLMNAICLDKDIKRNWQKIVEQFNIPYDRYENPPSIYDHLYSYLSQHMISSNMTRYQFLKQIHIVCDVSHICGKF